jgi:hypothetical protein
MDQCKAEICASSLDSESLVRFLATKFMTEQYGAMINVKCSSMPELQRTFLDRTLGVVTKKVASIVEQLNLGFVIMRAGN